ncbi:VCBS repeat-containing protein [Desulfohalobiaceae bacterium Ax17]|uniref:FG-GAP repeat domain-containing protein n=1 Tax=Desulfovulcanus ferrireducens TaxID=2831190 RepID=UPI00207BCA35|nr:VCBS repeat-containing protein [Desulfovulcanus ferrireducens]MBT8763325.1 VCBS repeat-containing protein [Desulfovulcanus ferrireducens]
MLKRVVLTLLALLAMAFCAFAGQQKTFTVLPFKIFGPQEYQYLSMGTQAMLTTRLTWPEHFTPVDQSKIKSTGVVSPQSKEQARAALQKIGSDYLIFGSITIMGKQCSLDVQVIDRQGNLNPYNVQTTLDELIPSLEKIAREINGQIFKRSEKKQESVANKNIINRMNPELIFNEDAPSQEFYLNPQFRYGGSPNTPGRWRSQALQFSAIGMVVGDADNDGKNEIFVLDDRTVYAYALVNNRLFPLAEYKTPVSYQCLNINLMDLNRDGYQEIIVSAIQDEFVRSFILNFGDKKFSVKAEKIPFFLNVVRTPPEYMPTLIGQRPGRGRLFMPDSVYEVVKMGGEYQLGRHIPVPEKTNVFNFTYLPQGADYKIIVADDGDHLRVYSSTKALQASTDEVYAASSLGLVQDETIPGLGKNKDTDPDFYYIPARLLPINLDKDNRYELLVSRPISVSSQFFSRYRFFPQGEIHCLYWDGIGLNIFWKTRRIKGSIVDYGVYDLNADGHKELVVCVNTHPGMTGFKKRKTIIVSYTLDLATPSGGK